MLSLKTFYPSLDYIMHSGSPIKRSCQEKKPLHRKNYVLLQGLHIAQHGFELFPSLHPVLHRLAVSSL